MNSCVCLVGWHYQGDLIEQLCQVAGLEVFIISHKPQNALPAWLYRFDLAKRTFFERNTGYDWGAYQQFIDKKIWRNFDTVFFMHDDLTLLDESIFQRTNDLVEAHQGKCIIGNGRVSTKRDWPRTHIQSYAHASWKPPSWDYKHDTVRGSFFALSSEALEQIGNLEVLWDRRGFFGIGAGNYSLRATCGKIQALLGNEAFQYLGEQYRQSPYMVELERGLEQADLKSHPWQKKLTQRLLVGFCRRIMTIYMNADPNQKIFWAKIMEKIFSNL